MAIGFIDKPAERPLVERILWPVRKGERTSEARVRDAPGYGRELRFTVEGELVASFLARDVRTLDAIPNDKLEGFRARDWLTVPVMCVD